MWCIAYVVQGFWSPPIRIRRMGIGIGAFHLDLAENKKETECGDRPLA